MMFLHLISLSLTICYIASKANEKFRVEKLNFVWSKAIVQLADEPIRLNKLMKDLATFDELYLSAKQNGSEDTVKSTSTKGIQEIDTKLEALLQLYDINDAIHAFRMKYKYDSDLIYSTAENCAKVSTEKLAFADSRVQAIWDLAKENKAFTLTEIDSLYFNLQKHQQKLDEYNIILKEISKHEKMSNHVAKDDDEKNKQFLNTVKQLNSDLEDNFQRISERVIEIIQNPFKNKKVRLLWEKALNNKNLIPNELYAIKSELRHFERRLEKFDYHKKHLDDHGEFSRGFGKDKDDLLSIQEFREHHEKMLRKVKKLEHYLNEKIFSVEHTEL